MGKWLGVEVAEWLPSGSWKDIFIGSYDYSYLFVLKWPYCRSERVERLPPFFAVNEPLPILLAVVMGKMHHCVACASLLYAHPF